MHPFRILEGSSVVKAQGLCIGALQKPGNFRSQKRGSRRLKSTYEITNFWAWLGRGSSGGPDDSEFHWSLTYRQESAVKNEFSTAPWRRTLCFHMVFIIHVSKTPFFACFSRKICSPGGNPLGHRETKSSQNDRKNTGFWKLVA